MLVCVECGRRLLRAAVTVEATGSTPEGSVGPDCARKLGLIKPRPAMLANRARRPRAPRPTAQMVLL